MQPAFEGSIFHTQAFYSQDVQDAAEKDWKDLATGQIYSLHKHGDKRDADVSGDIEMHMITHPEFENYVDSLAGSWTCWVRAYKRCQG